jgi:hypothetical protein
MRYLLLGALLFPMSLWAEGNAVVLEPESLEEALRFIPVILEALSSGNYLVMGAAISLVLTFLVRRFVLPKMGLGNGFLPVVAALLGMLAGVGGAILGGADMQSAVLAVMSGPLASVLWDSFFKYFFKK